MKRLRPLLLLFALLLSCNLPSQIPGQATETPALSEPPTPTPIAIELTQTPPVEASATPDGSTADLRGPVHPANAAGEWPLHNSGNTVNALLLLGDALWAGTNGGVVRWDLATGDYQRFTAAEGQPITAVYDLAADPEGQIWAVGAEGAAIYHGPDWQPIPQAEMGLPEAPLRAIAIGGQGDIWVGGDEYFDYSGDPFYIPRADETQGGLARLTGGAWEVFDVVKSGLLSNQIYDLEIGSDGALWVASGQPGNEPTPGGLSRRDPGDGAWTHYTIDDGLDGFAFSRLKFGSDGTLWAGGRRGLSWCRVGAGAAACRKDSPEGVRWQSLELFNIQALAFDRDGTLWIGTHTGLHEYRQGALTPVDLGEVSIAAIAPAAGELWIGTELSLARLPVAGETLDRRYTTDGPISNAVLSLAAAEDGSLWVLTRGGVSRLSGDRWEHYLDERKAIEAVYPWPLNRPGLWPVDSEGGVWLRDGAQLWRYDGVNWTDASSPEGAVSLLAPDPGGGVWAVNETSLLRYLGGSWQTVTSLADLQGFFGASDLQVDSQGTLWLASAIPYIDGGGVYRWDGGGWTVYTETAGLAGNATGDLALAPDGQLWAAHSVRGLSRFDGSAWHVEVDDPRALGLGADGFNSITFVDADIAWFRLESHCGFEGTCFDGIARKTDDQWTAFHAEPGGLPTDFVSALAVDDGGGVWLGTGAGVVSVPADR